jgi:hypothetical protein
VSLSFHRTLRVPEDDQDYPLPPGLGRLPVEPVQNFAQKVPHPWRRHDAVFVPLYQREALWVGFDGRWWHPSAVTIAAGGINVITGHRASETLSADPQDYLVVPDQPWIDGFHLQAGVVRQFVAAPLGVLATVSEQRDSDDGTALRFRVFEAVEGRFPEHEPAGRNQVMEGAPMAQLGGFEMGFAAGGRIVQRLYRDEHGFESWQPRPSADLVVYVVNSEMYQRITGRPTPPTPVTAEDYTRAGLPWFELYDEARSAISTEQWLHRIKTLGQIDDTAAPGPVSIDPAQVRGVTPN